MDPELRDALLDLLHTLEQGADLAIADAPAIVQEVIAHGRLYETATWLFFVGMLIWSGWFWRIAWRLSDDRRHDGLVVVIGMLAFSLGLTGFISLVVQLRPMVKVWLAPRLYVLEWIAGLEK